MLSLGCEADSVGDGKFGVGKLPNSLGQAKFLFGTPADSRQTGSKTPQTAEHLSPSSLPSTRLK